MLTGTVVRLRAIETEDLPLLVKWRNDPTIYRFFYEHEPLSLEMQRRWFEAFLQRKDERYWIAERLEDLSAIGTVALLNVDWRNRCVELGRVLVADTAHRQTGFGREMVTLALQYAFEHLNMNRVCLDVFADNQAAVQLYRRLGFVEEGQLRQRIFAQNCYHDILLFAMLRTEYEAARAEA